MSRTSERATLYVIQHPDLMRRLYSPKQIAAAAFLGSPMAGCHLLAANFRELGLPDAKMRTLLWGAVATVLLLVVAFLVPANFPNVALPAAYTWGMLEIAKQLQGSAYGSHVEAGGAKQSNWRVAGIGVAWLFSVLLVLVGVLLFVPPEWLSKG